jgi:hypothetical protein
MGGRANDLVGRQYGRLMVIDRVPNKKGRVAFKCVCKCGNTTEVLAGSLQSGMTRSCGCLHREMSTKDLTGQQIGLWSVLSASTKRTKKGYIYWNCRCTCGVEKLVSAESLLNGFSSSCQKCASIPLKKQFCLQVHDTHVWGRTDDGACRACVKDKSLRANYGISLEEFIKIYDFQKGKCAICDKPLGSYIPGSPGWGKGNHIEVDHDHKKGKRVSVRGLLCGGRWQGCNRKLGKMDNVSWLQKTVRYIENPPAQIILSKEDNAKIQSASAQTDQEEPLCRKS